MGPLLRGSWESRSGFSERSAGSACISPQSVRRVQWRISLLIRPPTAWTSIESESTDAGGKCVMSDTKQATSTSGATPAMNTSEARAYSAASASSPLVPTTIRRRAPGPLDIQMKVLFCGVCHSDLHQVRSEWQNTMPTVYPCVPGHEIVGRVTKVGNGVQKFKEGDLAAVGCLVDSDRSCSACREGLEQFCEGPPTFTYNAPDVHLGGVTYGGYSESIVVDQDFVLRVPDGLDPAGAAPLLCAGITTYSPLRHWNVGKGQKVGVVGLGGLGHMAVKLAGAFGARVVVLTTSPGKTEDAVRLGAHDVVVS